MDTKTLWVITKTYNPPLTYTWRDVPEEEPWVFKEKATGRLLILAESGNCLRDVMENGELSPVGRLIQSYVPLHPYIELNRLKERPIYQTLEEIPNGVIVTNEDGYSELVKWDGHLAKKGYKAFEQLPHNVPIPTPPYRATGLRILEATWN